MSLRLVEHANERVHEYTVHIEPRTNILLKSITVVVCSVAAVAWALHSFAGNVPALQVSGIIIAVAVAVAVCFWALQTTSESVIVLKGVGVLLVSRQRCGGSSSRFLDGQDIHSVFIHETLTTTNIHTHLAFILYSSDSLALAFPRLSPGQSLLVPLYQQLRQLHKIGDMAPVSL